MHVPVLGRRTNVNQIDLAKVRQTRTIVSMSTKRKLPFKRPRRVSSGKTRLACYAQSAEKAWMPAVVTDLRTVYALTGERSGKMRHIQMNDLVSWVFSTPDQTDLVTLRGRAHRKNWGAGRSINITLPPQQHLGNNANRL